MFPPPLKGDKLDSTALYQVDFLLYGKIYNYAKNKLGLLIDFLVWSIMKESTTEGYRHYNIHVDRGKSHGDSGPQKMKMKKWKSRHPKDIYAKYCIYCDSVGELK